MAEVKKVLEIIPTLACGGAEHFVVDLSNELSRRVEVTILCFAQPEGGDFFRKRLNPQVKVINIGYRHCQSRIALLWLMIKAWIIIIKLKPDVIHCHLGGVLFAAPAILTHIPPVPYVYTVHNDAFFDAGFNLWQYKLLFRWGRGCPVTISAESQASFWRAYGFDAPLIVNGVRTVEPTTAELDAVRGEVAAWHSFPDSRLLVNIARICPQKNQLALAQAVVKVVAEGVRVDVVFVGEVIDAQIKTEILKLNCPNLHFAGVKDNPLPYLAQSNGLILSSIFEGLPITLLEALALGIPGCVTPVGGMKNLIQDEVNGLVAEGTTVEDLAVLLRRFCALSEKKRTQMGVAARASYRSYSIADCAASYLKLMNELK